MINLRDKKILLTGAKGFLGTYVMEKLIERGVPKSSIRITESSKQDLRDMKTCEKMVKGMDIVINCAGKVGGIGYALKHPAEIYYDNAAMSMNLIEASRKENVEKLTIIGSACAYPQETAVPYRESELWKGYPDKINATYGLAKRFALVQQQSYKEEYGLNSVHLVLANLYGPGDDFSIDNSHVIAALVRRSFEAVEKNQKELVVWGTGKASREFLRNGCALIPIFLRCSANSSINP